MYRRTITTPNGLHAKTAAFFVRAATAFRSDIWVEKEATQASAKSLLGVIGLGVAPGDEITIEAEGPDEEAAVDRLLATL